MRISELKDKKNINQMQIIEELRNLRIEGLKTIYRKEAKSAEITDFN